LLAAGYIPNREHTLQTRLSVFGHQQNSAWLELYRPSIRLSPPEYAISHMYSPGGAARFTGTDTLTPEHLNAIPAASHQHSDSPRLTKFIGKSIC